MARPPFDDSRKPARSRTFKAPSAAKSAPEKSDRPILDKPAPDKGERIAKVLARAGVASRRDAEKIILEGRVAVNGKEIDSPALTVTPRDRILVDGKPLAAPEPPRLWLYHKPEGLVTTARDELGRPTVFDYLPEDLPRVMTVGRLDLTSEGLLLLTNDGELKRKLELPSTGWLRKYRVRVNGRPEDTDFEPLRQGIVIDGEVFQPMVVILDRQQGANAWLTVGIREGRNREVRRGMEAVGYTVNRLIRTSYGPFQLGDLKSGEITEVRPRMLRDQLGLAETPMPVTQTRAGANSDKPGPDRKIRAPRPGRTTDIDRDESPRGRKPRPVGDDAFERGGPRKGSDTAGQNRPYNATGSRDATPARNTPPREGAAKPARPAGGLGRGGARTGATPPRGEGPKPPRRPTGGGAKR